MSRKAALTRLLEVNFSTLITWAHATTVIPVGPGRYARGDVITKLSLITVTRRPLIFTTAIGSAAGTTYVCVSTARSAFRIRHFWTASTRASDSWKTTK